MFAGALKEIGGYFDRRWLLSALLPSLAFWAGLLLVHDVATEEQPYVIMWRRQPLDLQIMLGFIAIGWIAFFAYTAACARDDHSVKLPA